MQQGARAEMLMEFQQSDYQLSLPGLLEGTSFSKAHLQQPLHRPRPLPGVQTAA